MTDVSRLATRRIRIRGLHAGLMTLFCSVWTQDWLWIPLIVVDSVFFLRQSFLSFQELGILYGDDGSKNSFTPLYGLFLKVGGATFKGRGAFDVIKGAVKKGVQKAIDWALKRGVRLFRAPLRSAVVQAGKVVGITAGREMQDMAINAALSLLQAIIAATVTYFMLVGLGRGYQKRAKECRAAKSAPITQPARNQ